MDLIVDVLFDSVKDTAQLIPFLFLTYLAMEALEHGTEGRLERLIARADAAGPFVGAILGALPQCGFSAMAATLFAGRVVSMGTLVAVILSTSDEMVPVFLAHQEAPGRLVVILAVKVLVGIVVGVALDMALRALGRAGDGHPHIAELCERAHCHCDDLEEGAGHEGAHAHDELDHVLHGHEHGHAHAHGHGTHGHARAWHIMRSALVHTGEVTLFIFLISFGFGLLIEGIGQDELAHLLGIHPVRATFAAGLIGMIPNCGASVAITELYLSGTLATGPMLAGLLASGGVGLLVLFRTNDNLAQNVFIAALVYAVGVACGLVAGALGIIL